MTIQLTGEMIDAAKAALAPNGCMPPGLTKALEVVLQIVERDYSVQAKPGVERAACGQCGHDNRYEIHRMGDGRWWCNDTPACYRRGEGQAA